MKKYLFLASVAALSFTACTNETEEFTGTGSASQQQQIAVFPVNQNVTKAAVQGTTFPTTNTMEVKAYQTQPSATGYFDKTTYTYQFLGGASDPTNNPNYWGGNPARYWPLSPAKLNFFAVSGAGVTASHITIADALASANVAYTSTNTYSATTQSDIMYAFNRAAVTKTGNTLTFPEKVDMEFHHALALINFQIKAKDNPSKAIQIYKIELNGARYTGSLAITNTNAATESDVWSATVDWTPDAVVNNVKVPSIGDETTPVALTTDFVPVNSATSYPASLMIIPSTQTPTVTQYGFTTFKIFYKFDGKDYNIEYAPAGWTGETPNVTNVEVGKKYTYQITMQLHEILVNPTVDDWDDATGSPSDVQL